MTSDKMDSIDTIFIKEEISSCDNIDDLKRIISENLSSQENEWKSKIKQIIDDNNLTQGRLGELCGVSRVTVNNWCKGAIPKSRDMFLKIGMAANYDIEQMNRLLQRYGRYPGLYSKSLEDCACIFVLNHNYGDCTIEKYNYILNKIKSSIISDDGDESENVSTAKFDRKLSEVDSEEELEQFISDNSALFSMSYNKLYAYIWANICGMYSENVFELAQAQGWSSSLKQCVSAIRQKKWYPTRNKIISLGIHLSLDHEQIDKMLELAHMEPLCAKNIFESIIMYILDDALLNDVMNEEAEDYDPDDLLRYSKKVLEELDLPEIQSFMSELTEIDDEW